MMDKGQKEAVEREAFQAWLERTPVEKALSLTDEGPPSLGEEERHKFLGHPRDRVIQAFTRSQLGRKESWTYVERAMRDPRASKVFIDGDVGTETAQALQEMAFSHDLEALITDSPHYRGDVGLIVTSDEAVDQDDIFV